TGGLNVHFKILQHTGGDAITLTKQTQEDMFGPNISMIERPGLLRRERQDFLHSWGVRDVADDFLIGPGADLFLDFLSYRVQIEPQLTEHSHRRALANPD